MYKKEMNKVKEVATKAVILLEASTGQRVTTTFSVNEIEMRIYASKYDYTKVTYHIPDLCISNLSPYVVAEDIENRYKDIEMREASPTEKFLYSIIEESETMNIITSWEGAITSVDNEVEIIIKEISSFTYDVVEGKIYIETVRDAVREEFVINLVEDSITLQFEEE